MKAALSRIDRKAPSRLGLGGFFLLDCGAICGANYHKYCLSYCHSVHVSSQKEGKL